MRSCGILLSTDHRHQQHRRWRMSSMILTFLCIILSSSFIILSSSKVIGERSWGGGGASKVHSAQEYHLNYFHHRHMQSSSQSSCIDISIFLDEYPADTSWTIVDNSTGTIMNTSPAYDDNMALTEQTTENICLAVPGTYSFIISDAYNDGLCCVWGEGSYTVTSSSSGTVLASGGVWKGPNETTTFALDAADPNPPTTNNNNAPTLQPTIYYNTPSIINNNTTIESDDATTTTTENQTITTQVNIYLTGVPNNNQNMTNQEQTVFETLFYTILHSRLETVDVNITKVVVDAQINNPEFDVDSPFESLQQTASNNGGGSGGGGDLPVLQLVTNITLTYSDPPPEGWRDWSIYLTSWIESFGPTMVDIFTDPKHELYPNEEFFNTISYVSATNVVPPNTDPTASPTLSPTYLGAPEYKKPLVAGMASSGVIVVVVFFLGAMWYKQRRLRMTRRTHNNNKSILPEEERNDDKKKMEEKELGGSLDGEENLSSSPDVMLESSSLPSTVHRSNKGDMSSRSSGGRRMFDNNYTMEELGPLDDEENPSSSPDAMLESTSLQSTVRRSNRGDMSSRSGGSRRMFDNNYTMEELGSLDEENPSSSPDDVMLESTSLQSTVRRSNRGDVSSGSGGRRRMFDDNYTMEELGSLDEENPSSSPDVMLESSSLQSTVRRSNRGDMSSRSGGSSSRGYDNNYHEDGSESIQTSRTILEEEVPPTPTQGALQDDFAQYDKIVAAVSANNPNLTQVVLDNTRQIGSNNDGGEALWQALATNKYVTLLSLRNSNIVDDQIAALALALNENTSISHLSFENNNITSEGVEYLVVCLECNSTIDVIDLDGNSPIDPRILDELKGILQSRAGQSNGVSDGNKKLDLLLERVRVNDPNLTKLDLHDMDIGPKDNDAIMDALAGNLYLRKVDLSSNVIDDDCVSALSLALAENTSITHLVLANNRITSIGAEYLLCALDTNETIVDVDLTGNSIDAEVIAELNHALEERSSF